MTGVWVGFTGTRKGATELQLKRVEQALYSLGTTWFVHGGAKGADRQAHKVAKEIGVKTRIRPIEGSGIWNEALLKWNKWADEILPGREPLERNCDIVNDSHFMLACPFGYEEEQRSGTWQAIRYARSIHKPLAIIWPDGTQSLEFWPGDKIPKGW